MKLIVGLGNPLPINFKNRHNVGFIILDYFCQDLVPNLKFKENKKTKSLELRVDKLILAKPLTFMNNSGEALKLLQSYYNILLKDILIVHDDIDQFIGSYKYVTKGGSGGHKGVQNIFDVFKTKQLHRLKIGVAPKNYNPTQHKAYDFVLKNLTKLELNALKKLYTTSLNSLLKDFVNGKSE